MKYHSLFLWKIGKDVTNLSSAAVVIGALRVNYLHAGYFNWQPFCHLQIFSLLYFFFFFGKYIQDYHILSGLIWVQTVCNSVSAVSTCIEKQTVIIASMICALRVEIKYKKKSEVVLVQ